MIWLLSAYYNEKGWQPGKMAYQVEVDYEDYLDSPDYKIFVERDDIGTIHVERL